MILLAIDPGATSGVAAFDLRDPARSLVWSWHGSIAAFPHYMQGPVIGKAVIEKPQVYKGEKADPNTLITLAVNVGEWKERVRNLCRATSSPIVEASTVLPREWKRQLPKAICHERVRVLLTPDELLRAWPTDHNARDAVALGMWATGRWRV